MAVLKQIAFEFDSLPATPAEPVQEKKSAAATTTTIAPVIEKPKSNRGRKPKQQPIVPPEPSKRGRLSMKEADEAAALVTIPSDEELFSRQYYSIGQVAEMFNVNHSLLRMWSKEFGQFVQTRTNKKGDRYFRPEDIKTLYLVHHLVRERKFTMQGAKDHIKKNKNASERFTLVQSLQQIKKFLLEIQATL
jgi:DNA-binding transcriptional MerR regulator